MDNDIKLAVNPQVLTPGLQQTPPEPQNQTWRDYSFSQGSWDFETRVTWDNFSYIISIKNPTRSDRRLALSSKCSSSPETLNS